MKTETYVTSKQGRMEYGYQLMSDGGELILDMVLGDSSTTGEAEKQLMKHHSLVTMMAAASDLLDALVSLHDACEYWECQNDAILVQARKAIARARGEKQ